MPRLPSTYQGSGALALEEAPHPDEDEEGKMSIEMVHGLAWGFVAGVVYMCGVQAGFYWLQVRKRRQL